MFTYLKKKKQKQTLIALLLFKTCSLHNTLNQLPERSSPFVHFAAFCLISTWMCACGVLPFPGTSRWPAVPLPSTQGTFCLSVSLAGAEVQVISRQTSSVQALHAHRCSSFPQESSFSILLQALSQCSTSALANSPSVSLECKFLSLQTGMIQKEPNSSCAQRDSGWILGKIS